MAIEIGDAVLVFGGDLNPLDKALSTAQSKVASGMEGLAAKAATVGKAFSIAGAGIVGALGLTVKAAGDSEMAQAQLGAVLKSTAGAAGLTQEELNKMSLALSRTTMFEDDAITAGQSMLLTFTNIGREVFPEATQTMLDMSQALGQDLKGSAIQLGKALNDPIAGVSALSKVGVTFTDQQKEQIKTMVEAGQVADAQRLILAELGREFGGSAAAAAGTFNGQLAQLKNEFGSLMEAIGDALTNGAGLAGLVTKIKEIVIAAQDWVAAHPLLVEWMVKIGAAVGLLLVALGPLLMLLPGIVSAFTLMAPLLGGIAGAAGFGGVGIAATGAGTALTAFMGPALAVLGPAGIIVAGTAVIATAISAWWDLAEAKKGANEATDQANASDQRLMETLRSQGVVIDELKMKEMSAEQQTAYLVGLQQQHEKDKFLAKMESFQQISRMTDEEVLGLRKLSGEQQKSLLDYVASLEKTTQSVDEKSTNARAFLARLSLDHHESPSINDMARDGIANYLSLMDGLSSSLGNVLGGIRDLFVNTWNEISSYVSGVIDGIVGAAQRAAQAVGNALGLGGGGAPGSIPGHAKGGVTAGGVAWVGERGPEPVFFPQGARVVSHQDAMSALRQGGSGGGGGPTFNAPLVNVGTVNASSKTDVDRLLVLIQDKVEIACGKRGIHPSFALRGRG